MVHTNHYIVLVVLYKCKPSDSFTVLSLINCKPYLSNSKIIIWDNSPSVILEAERDFLIRNLPNSIYIHTPENISLSKIYNCVIKENSSGEYFVVFDQDSSFDQVYFKKLEEATQHNKDINLFLPYVVHKKRIVSPGDYMIIKGKYWKDIQTGRIFAKNKAAISSGMAISFHYLNTDFKGYDERLTLYGIDTYFMLQYALHNQYFFVLNYELKHSLSIFEHEDVETVLKRFRNKKKCFAILHEKPFTKFLIVKSYIFYLSLKMSLLYRDIRFLE